MQLSIPVAQQQLLPAFLLAMVRAIAWLLICPPFSNRAIPRQVRVGFAASLALVSAPRLALAPMPTDAVGLMGAVVGQVLIGAAIGFCTVLLFSAVQAAGALIDLLGGFEMAQLFDPMAGGGAAVFGRFYNLVAITVLFAGNGHVLLARGFLASFNAVPGTELSMEAISQIGIEAIGRLVVAAIQIAAPLLAALFIAEVAMGVITRAAPQMNALLLGLPVKALVTITLVGVSLVAIPGAVDRLVRESIRAASAVVGG
jgi:flagellar biosynthetic protein FliR